MRLRKSLVASVADRFEYDADQNKEKYRGALREYESREQALLLIVAGNQLGLVSDVDALAQVREVLGVARGTE
jgi:hypothetical protein